MGRRKRKKFEHNQYDPRIIEPGKEVFEKIKGNRKKDFFKNGNPITLELACGKGEYSVGLGKIFPKKNFIGVDIKGERIRKGSSKAEELELTNIGFLRTIVQNIENHFKENEVDEIRVVHPDPRPRKGDAKKRLTHPRFLNIYKKIMKPGGTLFFKTDDTDLFHYSVETLVADGWNLTAITFDLYESELRKEHYDIKTHYEKLFTEQGRTVKYLRCISPKK